MREYAMSFRDTMELPLRTFWSLNRYIDRLRAEQDLRSLQVSTAAATASDSAEAVKLLTDALQAEIGSPIVVQKRFDAAQFERLKEKLKQPGI